MAEANFDDDSSEIDPPDPTLQHLIGGNLKWIFVGGKGGVGKTTTSCSLAVQLAQHHAETGGSVLIVSTDPAHNLADAFGQKFGKKETKVDGFENLFAMEIDPEVDFGEQEDFMGVRQNVGFLKELSSSIPGIDEAFAFAELMKRVKAKTHSVIVFDTAPTGHTLRLLSFPTTLELAFEKIEALRSKFGGMFSQVQGILGPMMGAQMPDQEQMAKKFEVIQQTVAEVKSTFQDPDQCTFVCVCIPEFLSLYETERLSQTLTKYGIDCGSIVINQVLHPIHFEPPSELEGTLKTICDRHIARVKMQQKYIRQYNDLYGEDFHLVQIPLLNKEVRQLDSLRNYGNLLINEYVPPDADKQENVMDTDDLD